MNPIQVIAVTGGKGGVGKTNVSVNLGIALCRKGRRVTLLDADLGLANVDVLLGLKPTSTLKNVLEGSATLQDVLIEGPEGIHIVPAASGLHEMASLGPAEHAGIIGAFNDIAHQMDVLLIDTAAGISSEVTSFLCAAQEIIMVVCDEPASITDAYALIKVLSTHHKVSRVRIVSNMVRGDEDSNSLFDKLQAVTSRFLDITLVNAGSIPFDESLRKAIQKQQPIFTQYANSPAAKAFARLADQIDSWPIPAMPSGHLEFFVDQLVQENRA